ncbi:AAA family ATPase [Mycobacterium lacus]|nr:hypothetical protein [Mycobacterium lacus]
MNRTDFTAMLADAAVPEPREPDVLRRGDGVGLFYRGGFDADPGGFWRHRHDWDTNTWLAYRRTYVMDETGQGRYDVTVDETESCAPGAICGLFGPTEAGKTMIATAGCAEGATSEERGLRPFLYLDVDRNGADAFYQRMTMLGADRDYLHPDADLAWHAQPADAEDLQGCVEDFASFSTGGVAVMDAVNEMVGLFDGNPNQTDDYLEIVRLVSDPLIRAGHCVLLLDHTGHGASDREVGSHAKRAVISGSSIEVRPVRQFTPGRGGAVELWVAKDRPGQLRRCCPPGRGVGRCQFAGTFVLDPPREDGVARWRVEPPTGGRIGGGAAHPGDRVIEAARALGDEFTADRLSAAVHGREPTRAEIEAIRRTIDELVDEGEFVVVREGRKGRGGAAVWAVQEHASENHGDAEADAFACD